MALNWVQTKLPFVSPITRVNFIGDGTFLLTSSYGIARSTDKGKTWATVSGAPEGLAGVASNGSIVVGVLGNDSYVSNDKGLTWTKHTGVLSNSVSYICYDDVNKVFVAIHYSRNTAAYSSDGVNWTYSTMPNSFEYGPITAGGGKVVAPVRHPSSGSGTNIMNISTDGGKTWSTKSAPIYGNWSDIAYYDGKFTIINEEGGSTNIGLTTADFTNWLQPNLGAYTTFKRVAAGAGRIVALGGTAISESTDGGNTFTYSGLPYVQSTSYDDIAYGDGVFVVTSGGNRDVAWYASVNTEPTTPASITFPSSVRGGSSVSVSWAASTDAEGNLAGYVLERSLNGGTWTQIYKGVNRSFTDTVPYGSTSVNYRVAAYDIYSAYSGYRSGNAVTVINNTAPTITGSDGALGTFGTTFTAQAYTVNDAQGGTVTVTERLDGVVKRSYAATLGTAASFSFTAAEWQQILNGSHTITITAVDQYGDTTVRTWTFIKAVNTFTFTITPLAADAMPTKCVVGAYGAFPASSTLKVEVCNNANDASPTWEDISAKLNKKHFFSNAAKTASAWAFGLRVTLMRGNATGDCYLDYVNINFA